MKKVGMVLLYIIIYLLMFPVTSSSVKGTQTPMNGSITGEKQTDGSYIHKFTYVGVPSVFKIAILKSDGTLIISDTAKRTQFQSVMEYTLGTSGISEKADTYGTVREVFSKNYV